MRKLYVVRLQEEERAQLQALVRKGKAAAYKLTHARVLLKADQGASRRRVTDQAVAAAVEVGPATVARIRQQFVEEGLDAALRRSHRSIRLASDGSMGRPRPRSSRPRVASRPRVENGGRCAS